MPFAYAGTRRRRNRDRRRTHDEMQQGPAHAESGSNAKSAADAGGAREKGQMPPGVGERDLHDPGSRDPDAPPVENNS